MVWKHPIFIHHNWLTTNLIPINVLNLSCIHVYVQEIAKRALQKHEVIEMLDFQELLLPCFLRLAQE